MLKGIGSVLPSADPAAMPIDALSVWTRWTADGPDVSAFSTARAALAALLTARCVKRLWLPAYCCDSLAEAARARGVELAWYAVDARLQASTADLEAGLVSGDAVVAIAYFGRAPDDCLRALASRRQDALWIEDRAQALDTTVPSLGAITLYSPRKLLGVADGGLLVGADLPVADPRPIDQAELWRPNDLRRADPEGLAPDAWFSRFQAREAAFDASSAPSSARTLTALQGFDPTLEIRVRRRNWGVLAQRLGDLMLWDDPAPAFAPLAFPVVIDDASALGAYLAERGIWAARHWTQLPSPASYRAAHDLSAHCLSLPLDGRYDRADMERVADAVLSFANS